METKSLNILKNDKNKRNEKKLKFWSGMVEQNNLEMLLWPIKQTKI